MKKNIIAIIVIGLISIPAIFSLLQPGFFQSDDGEWMIIRFSAFYQGLGDGQFPTRLLTRLNFGYGYPVANFLYPLFMYAGVPIHALGFGFVDTIKIILGSGIILSGIFCYFWLSRFFTFFASIVGAAIYILTPYHLYDLYKRGSVGEIVALAIVPFIGWQIERKSIWWTSLGIGMLILAHNTLALLFIGFFALYSILDIYNTKNKFISSIWYGKVFVLGFLLSAFFSVPALFDLQYTIFRDTTVSEWDKYFVAFPLVGLSSVIILASIPFVFFLGLLKPFQHRVTILLFLIGIVSIFMSTSASAQVWHILPVSFIQFPFRFLSLTILAVSFVSAAIISLLPKKIAFTVGLVFLIATLFSAVPYLRPSEFFDKGESYYSTNEGSTTVKNEYMNKYSQKIPFEHPQEKIELIKGEASIHNLSVTGKSVSFTTQAKKESTLEVNTSYFPGWKAFVNNQENNIQLNEKSFGEIQIIVPSGNSFVSVVFSETPLRKIANTISILSFIVLCILALLEGKKKFI